MEDQVIGTPKATFYIKDLAHEIAELYIDHKYDSDADKVFKKANGTYQDYVTDEFDAIYSKVCTMLDTIKIKKLATYWVLQTGTDCDGYNSGRVYAFDNEDDAYKFADDQNEWTDGMGYGVTDKFEIVQEYCEDYNLNINNYKKI